MKHKYSMEGFAYRLRPIKKTDASFIIEIRLEDMERNQYIHKISRDVAEQEKWLDLYFEREGDYYFVIENRLTGEREGLISFYDAENGRAEWGRWVIKKGSLAAVESVDLLYRIAFEKVGLTELYCRTLAVNTQVVSMHESMGELTRGIETDAFELEDGLYDAVVQYSTRQHFYEKIHPDLESRAMMIFKRNLRRIAGTLKFHHIGVACKDVEREFPMFSILGYHRESPWFEDETQGIAGMFITAEGQPRLELMEDINDSGTLAPHIKSGNKMYHFAYTVSRMDDMLQTLQKAKAKMISSPQISSYFGGRICFLVLPNMYMIELIEEKGE